MEQTHRRKTDRRNAKKHNLLLDIFAYGTLAILAAVLGTVLFWTFWPYHVIDVGNARMTESTVHQGDVTTYSTDYEKFLDYPTHAQRQFIDGLIFDAGEYDSTLPVGKGHLIREIPIPETLPPGEYHLQVTLRYKVNPIRTVVVTFQTDEFKVLPLSEHADAAVDAKE